MKRAFIIHGWGGNPGEGWFPWLAAELTKHRFVVSVPAMPHTDEPTIADWVGHVAGVVGTPDEETYLVGHSIGCQTILRYLETLPEGVRIGGIVLVAGWLKRLTGLETEEEERIAKPWVQTPLDTAKISRHAKGVRAIFSDDDPFILLENAKFMEERLGAVTTIEHGKGHFSGSDGVRELPSALRAVLDMSE